ncbi:MAG: hypothetical protein L6Q37_14700 [Bdellovibrionaceae bacterium]|nr:hypothetical protein [Pseudobdellovibrionaceae bacterium]NUM60476.1 hypothetical protein [Pseudobdellovibrionaceae bacterium]
MKSYSPPKKSFLEKLLQNSTIVFLLTIIVLITATFVYLKKNNTISSDITFPRKTIFIANSKINAKEPSTIENNPSLNTENSSTSPTPGKTSLNQEASSNHPTNEPEEKHQDINSNLNNSMAQPNSISANSTGAKNSKIQLIIEYAEITLKGFYFLEDEAKASGQYSSSDYSQGVINFGKQKIKSQRADIKIYAQEQKILNQGENEVWFQGLKGSTDDTNIGIKTNLKVNEIIDGGKINAELKITNRFQVNLTDSNSKNFQSLDYLGSIELLDDQYYFISNVLTTRPMTTQQDYLTSMTPFEILKSLNFKTGETISVFFYHFQK